MNPFLLTLLKNYNEKDMTQEEKAKAYDEALERANKELQACGSTDCNAAKQIFRFFPELKESEDEKIRKELIQYIKNWKANIQGKAYPYLWSSDMEECNKLLAWLEKQGEKKPIEWSKEDERIYYSILADIRTKQEGSTSTLEAYYNEQISWLKSLKQGLN